MAKKRVKKLAAAFMKGKGKGKGKDKDDEKDPKPGSKEWFAKFRKKGKKGKK